MWELWSTGPSPHFEAEISLRILLASHVFQPSIGGIETVSRLLAEHWQRLGHEVIVVTTTTTSQPNVYPYCTVRRPTAASLFRLLKWSDVFFQNNISLRTAWPITFIRRPFVVTTQTWLGSTAKKTGWSKHLKLLALRRAKNVYISRAVAAHIGLPGEVIPNPFDATTFRPFSGLSKDLDLVFVGRLVSDKGVDDLLRALALLKARSIVPRTTIIGSGPEEAHLREKTRELGLTSQVVFAGAQRGTDLAHLIARHRIMVVPSRWAEPFGVVALEGIACGCAIVGSAGGGLPDAIGPCGVTFPNGSADSLADTLADLLHDGLQITTLLDAATYHLAKHAPDAIARRYLEVFAQSIDSKQS